MGPLLSWKRKSESLRNVEKANPVNITITTTINTITVEVGAMYLIGH